MRLAFWRAGKGSAVSRLAPLIHKSVAAPDSDDPDLRAIGPALMRKRNWIIAPTLFAAVLSIIAVNTITPRYKSEARILIDGRENAFLKPSGEGNEGRNPPDVEAVASQLQLLRSR